MSQSLKNIIQIGVFIAIFGGIFLLYQNGVVDRLLSKNESVSLEENFGTTTSQIQEIPVNATATEQTLNNSIDPKHTEISISDSGQTSKTPSQSPSQECNDDACFAELVAGCLSHKTVSDRVTEYGKRYTEASIKKLSAGNCRIEAKYVYTNKDNTVTHQGVFSCESNANLKYDPKPLLYQFEQNVYIMDGLTLSLRDPEQWANMKETAEALDVNPIYTNPNNTVHCKIVFTDLSQENTKTNEDLQNIEQSIKSIKKDFSTLRALADVYFGNNKGYKGLCLDEQTKDIANTIKSSKGVFSCLDSEEAYRASTPLLDKTNLCIDSEGRYVIGQAPKVGLFVCSE